MASTDNKTSSTPGGASSEDSAAETDMNSIDLEKGTDKVGKVMSMYYKGKSMVQDKGGLMEVIPADKEVTLNFKNISSWVPNMLFGQAKKDAGDSAPAKRQVNNASHC